VRSFLTAHQAPTHKMPFSALEEAAMYAESNKTEKNNWLDRGY